MKFLIGISLFFVSMFLFVALLELTKKVLFFYLRKIGKNIVYSAPKNAEYKKELERGFSNFSPDHLLIVDNLKGLPALLIKFLVLQKTDSEVVILIGSGFTLTLDTFTAMRKWRKGNNEKLLNLNKKIIFFLSESDKGRVFINKEELHLDRVESTL